MTTPHGSYLGRIIFLAVLLLLPAPGRASDAANGNPTILTGTTMGTTYTVRVAHLPAGVRRSSLHSGIEQVLDTIDRRMSTYRSDSEISRFNVNPSTAWIAVSPETEEVVAAAQRVSRLSDGAFDVTISPLIDLWGFGSGIPRERFPSKESIDAVLIRVGYSLVEVRRSPPALRKRRANVRIDLSAIAKGFAVDRVARYLQTTGVGDYLVEIGGEIRAQGYKEKDRIWTVAVESPDSDRFMASAIVRLNNTAIATSGDYRNYFDRDGVRYSHIIDPRTGAPIVQELAAVAVVDGSAMQADALATALMVLGPKEGLRLAVEQHLAALFIVRGQDGFEQRRTVEFERIQVR